jgi:hypothetical protein
MHSSRVVSRAVLGVVLALSFSVIPVGQAAATTGEMHLCTHPEINNGKVMRAVTLKHSAFKMTHAVRKRIPAGVRFSRAVTLETTTVIGASLSASATVKADAGAFFAKASVEASVSLAGNFEKTTKETTSEKFTVPKANKQRVFVFYSGNDTFRLRAHKRTCGRDGQNDYFGTLRSWNVIEETGAVQCPHTRYKKGSISHQVTLNAGC